MISAHLISTIYQQLYYLFILTCNIVNFVSISILVLLRLILIIYIENITLIN